MRKIPTLFVRDFEGALGPPGRFVLPVVAEGCEWVAIGEGVATRKHDGTAVLVQNGQVFKRREVRDGKQAPFGFTEVERDDTTGKSVGWVSYEPADPADRWLCEALVDGIPGDGTYELIGPKVQGNPEQVDTHRLVRHGSKVLVDVPRSYQGLAAWLPLFEGEGVVWHHPDGRMAKIKRRDAMRNIP